MNFSFSGLSGGVVSLAAMQGEVVLVVNTASKCGFTPQYTALEQLYQARRAQGLVVVGVPCDDFGGQEPGSETGIAARRFGWLGRPWWNFHKYLIGRDGALAGYFFSTTGPDNARLVAAVDRALAAKPHQA